MVGDLAGIESNRMGSSRSSGRVGEEGDWELEAGAREKRRDRGFSGDLIYFFPPPDFVSGTALRVWAKA
jgi:hypothetical protein